MKGTLLRFSIYLLLGSMVIMHPGELAAATKKKSSSNSSSAAKKKSSSSGTSGKKATAGSTPKPSAAKPSPTPDVDQSSLPPEPLPEAKPSASPSPGAKGTATPSPASSAAPDATATLSTEDIIGFSEQPEKVRRLLSFALALTRQNLTYKYDSADPAKGGMDCSGFVYYVLNQAGITDVPRQANEQYVWLRQGGAFRAVLSRKSNTFELDELRPGDLLFWTGTYKVDRDPPVTHTMIYLGREKGTKARVMVGSSDGRTYHDIRRNGVSVFDFKVDTKQRDSDNNADALHPQFVGYARVPGIRDE